MKTKPPLTLTTRQVPAAIRRGEILDTYPWPGGAVTCSACLRETGGRSQYVPFWSKGMKIICPHCRAWELARPTYDGLVLDLSR